MSAVSADRIRVFLCGDVMTGRGLDQILRFPGSPELREPFMTSADDYVRLAERASGVIPRRVPPTYVWGAALDEWARARPDLRIGNLETSITRTDDFAPKGINYRMSPANAECLPTAGFSCLALANNHVLDFGPAGLVETLTTLKTLGIRTCGAGRNLEEARRPAVCDLGSRGRVIIFSLATPDSGIAAGWAAAPARAGINLVEPSPAAAKALAGEVAAWRRPGDIVVVSIHWGPNWGYEVSEDKRRFAHALIERAGVSIVHGHSSHHALGPEVHAGRLILYGCGDFLNDYEGIGGHEQFRNDLPVMYFADVRPDAGELLALEMVPLKLKSFRLVRAPAGDLAAIGAILRRQGARFGARVAPAGDRFVVRPPAPGGDAHGSAKTVRSDDPHQGAGGSAARN